MFPTTPTNQSIALSHPGPTSEPPPTQRPLPNWLIILVFCFFAGTISETFLTPSTSPTHILRDPYTLPFNIIFYGTFDLLAREIIVRRRAGLASVLLLGAAYGMINEGVAAGSWYVYRPQGYVFIGGVNWAWVVSITLFHAVFSVITPIAFIEILFPSVRSQRLLRRRGIVACMVLLLGCIGVAILVLAAQPLTIFWYRLTVLMVAILFSLIAWALPSARVTPTSMSASGAQPLAPQPPTTHRPPPGLWRLRIAGFLATFAYFLLTIPFVVLLAGLLQSRPGGLIIAQGIDGVVFLAFGALVIWRGWTWSQRAGWSPRQNLALLIGGVTFTTLLLNLTAAPMGEAFSTLPFYALLIALTLIWRRRAKASTAVG